MAFWKRQKDTQCTTTPKKEMWQCTHRLSKYRPKATSALRNKERTWCHTDSDEIAAIQRYQTRELFMQDTPTIPQTYHSAQIPEYTPTDVRLAMRSQRPWKSVPRWAAPVAAWRICEEECIASVCEVWTQTALQGAPPDTWRRHETCHIPKPHKDPTIPDNLRPINLTCPLHRCYLYQLNRDMKNHLLHK